MARPKKQPDDCLPVGWQVEVLDMYKEGCSDVKVRSYLGGISHELFERWLAEIDEFSEVIKKGRVHSQAWWEDQGHRNLGAGRLNTALWQINMRNRFGWKDSREPDDPKVPTTVDFVFKEV